MRRIAAHLWFKVFGWKLVKEGELPRKFVFIAAPHTSNWDMPHMIAVAWMLGIKIRWLGKHTLFKGPMGWFFRAWGGVPVDRTKPQGLVSEVAARFEEADTFILGVPPEGTRGLTEYWKSGFYHIAVGAGVPIGFGFLDYGGGRCGVGGFFTPTGDVTADMDQIRAFYRNIKGKFPAKQCVPKLREEDALKELPKNSA